MIPTSTGSTADSSGDPGSPSVDERTLEQTGSEAIPGDGRDRPDHNEPLLDNAESTSEDEGSTPPVTDIENKNQPSAEGIPSADQPPVGTPAPVADRAAPPVPASPTGAPPARPPVPSRPPQPQFRSSGGGYQQRQHEPQPRRQDQGAGPSSSHLGHRPPQPASSATSNIASVGEAVLELQRAITMLKNAVDKMEEVLETLEDAELQKQVDEREIEKLRETVRQLSRPRENFGARERDRERERFPDRDRDRGDRGGRPGHRGSPPQSQDARSRGGQQRPAVGGQPSTSPVQEREATPPPREEHVEQIAEADTEQSHEPSDQADEVEKPQEDNEIRRYE